MFVEDHKKQKKKTKSSVLHTLREKMGIRVQKDKTSSSSEDETVHGKPPKKSKTHMARIGNKSASKDKKRVEVGWINNGKQVRTPRGGGTRKLELPKNSNKENVIEEIIPLFFPNGKSTLGRIQEFTFSLADFSQREITTETIGELYLAAKMATLRLYLVTNRKDSTTLKPKDNSNDSSEEELPDPSISLEKDHTSTPVKIASSIVKKHPPEQEEVHVIQITDMSTGINQENCNQQLETIVPTYNLAIDDVSKGVILADVSFVQDSSESNNLGILHDIQNYSEINADIGTFPMSSDHEETIPLSDCTKQAIVKRGNIFTDLMIFLMKEPLDLRTDSLTVKILSERGEDSGGVFRDAMTEFWQTFYLKHTEGSDIKIPTTVHIMKEEEWQAVGKAIVFCYKQEKYLPIHISKMFLEQCIYKTIPTEEDLIKSFMGYLPTIDRDIVKAALDDFDTVENDDIFDALSRFHLRVLPNKNNFRKLINDVAHHELVQKPSFVALCWGPILQNHLKPLIYDLEMIYNESEVTRKKVLKALAFPEMMTNIEKDISEFLKRFLKTCSQETLTMFVRFCTGSDILLGKEITVRMTPPMPIFELSPIAHTCGCVLEISKSYDSYLLLREHFQNILDSKVLRMDII